MASYSVEDHVLRFSADYTKIRVLDRSTMGEVSQYNMEYSEAMGTKVFVEENEFTLVENTAVEGFGHGFVKTYDAPGPESLRFNETTVIGLSDIRDCRTHSEYQNTEHRFYLDKSAVLLRNDGTPVGESLVYAKCSCVKDANFPKKACCEWAINTSPCP